MKHFLLLLILLCVAYFTWALSSRSEKRVAKRITAKHAKPLALIVLVLLAGLVLAFYSHSINLL